MSLTDVLAVVTSAEQTGIFMAADALAQKCGAHISMLQLSAMPEPLAGVGTELLWAQALEATRGDAAEQKLKIQAKMKQMKSPAQYIFVETPSPFVADFVARQARYGDLMIVERPAWAAMQQAFEGALFKSGRPVLVMPPAWGGKTLGENIVIAWKPTREATRAVADAAPLLATAKRVTVLAVGSKDRSASADLTAYLARHGVKAEAHNVDAEDEDADVVIAEEARRRAADLIVMGGYGHSRIGEFIFGGVTRGLVHASQAPLFLSH